MSDAEQNYNIHNKKLLAIVSALKHWRVYAENCTDLKIYTDYKNLLQFITTKKLMKWQVWWSEELNQYKFKIIYILEKDNVWADALNRQSNLMNNKTETVITILKQTLNRSLILLQSLNLTMHITDNSLINQIRSAFIENDISREFSKNERELIVKEKQILIFTTLKEEIVQRYYNSSVIRHLKINKIINLIIQNYWFLAMRGKIEKYIKEYLYCQQNKSVRYLKYRQL